MIRKNFTQKHELNSSYHLLHFIFFPYHHHQKYEYNRIALNFNYKCQQRYLISPTYLTD